MESAAHRLIHRAPTRIVHSWRKSFLALEPLAQNLCNSRTDLVHRIVNRGDRICIGSSHRLGSSPTDEGACALPGGVPREPSGQYAVHRPGPLVVPADAAADVVQHG